MENKKRQLWKNMLVMGILSAILLSGCGKENAPEEVSLMDNGNASTATEKDSTPGENDAKAEQSAEYDAEAEQPAENTAPGEKVIEQAISEWKEMYASFYTYQDCSAVLVERTENDGTVSELFTLDITYLSGQPESNEPEHFIADLKADYPADHPEDITLWMDNSGGAMADFMLFKECGPG